MVRHAFRSVNPVALAVAIISVPSAAAGQVVPRTSWGHADLQGTWSTATITPLERPADLAGKEFFTEAGSGGLRARTVERTNRDQRPSDAAADVARAYNDFWWDSGTRVVPTRRTSLIVDPPDGRIPPLTPEAQQRQAALAEVAEAARSGGQPRGSQPVGALHHARAADGDAAAGLQQQLSDHADEGSRRDPRGDDPRRAHHPARRPAAPAEPSSATGWAIRSAAGKATRSSSRRRISPTRRTTAARVRTCGSSSASRAPRRTSSRTGHHARSDHVHAAVDHRAAGAAERRTRSTNTRATKRNYGLEGILRGHRAEEQRAATTAAKKSQQ